MYLGNSRAGGGVDGIGAREGFQGQELIEGTDDLFWIGQNGNKAEGIPRIEQGIKDFRKTGSVLGLAKSSCTTAEAFPIPPITHRANFDKSRSDRASSLARRSIATPSHLQSRTDGPILKRAVPDNRSQIRHA